MLPLEPSPERRAQLGTNAGVLVYEVVEGSPAFSADLVPNDALLTIGGDRVESIKDFFALLDKHAGTKAVIQLDRNGERLEKTVEIKRRSPAGFSVERPGS